MIHVCTVPIGNLSSLLHGVECYRIKSYGIASLPSCKAGSERQQLDNVNVERAVIFATSFMTYALRSNSVVCPWLWQISVSVRYLFCFVLDSVFPELTNGNILKGS